MSAKNGSSRRGFNRDGNRIIYDGYPSMDEIKEANGWPDEERFAKGPVAVVECVQQIPCNPCESACPLHAIHIGEPITNTPQVDREKMYRMRHVRGSLSGTGYFPCG